MEINISIRYSNEDGFRAKYFCSYIFWHQMIPSGRILDLNLSKNHIEICIFVLAYRMKLKVVDIIITSGCIS